MALPLSKQELADWILRRLGAPVINIEVTDVQLEDCIDEAVQFFQEYHYDGTERAYRTIKITEDVLLGNNRPHQNVNAPTYDVANVLDYRKGDRVMTVNPSNNRVEKVWVRFDSDSDAGVLSKTFDQLWIPEQEALASPFVNYDYTKQGQVGIPIPENIIGITKVFRVDNFSGMGMWNYEYQYFLNHFDFFYGNGGASSMPMTNYYTTKTYMEMIDQMMNIQPAIRYNKHRNRLYIDTSWTRIDNSKGNGDYYLIMECYEANDPEIWGDVYKDKWLKRYATAITKMQWGSNLKKYQNTELPGGIMLSGQELYDEGKEEAQALEEELKNSQLELDFFMG